MYKNIKIRLGCLSFFYVWYRFISMHNAYMRKINPYGPCAGALDTESPNSNKNKTKNMLVTKYVFYYGFAPYFACAKL